jgi:hypothetical protein
MAAKLKLVDTSGGGSPRPLGQHGAALWRRIVQEYDVSDEAGRELLCLACQALDRAEACREVIDEHGEAFIVQPSGMVRQNPLLRDELANRSFVAKTLERLGVNSEPTKPVGRPTGSWQYEKAPKQSA